MIVQLQEATLVLRQLGAIGNVVDLPLNGDDLARLFGQLLACDLQSLLLLVELALSVALVTVRRDMLGGPAPQRESHDDNT